MYEPVEAVRPIPLARQTVVALALAALPPMLPVVALEIPLKEILLKLATAIL